MRITSKKFNKKAIYHNGKHYFPYTDDVIIKDEKLSIQACYFIRSRNKWMQDSFYLTDLLFVRELFSFAVDKKLITEFPQNVSDFLSTQP